MDRHADQPKTSSQRGLGSLAGYHPAVIAVTRTSSSQGDVRPDAARPVARRIRARLTKLIIVTASRLWIVLTTARG